jgi:hypothetical protein
MHARNIIFKFLLFIILFSAVFWTIRLNNYLPQSSLNLDMRSIPTLFGVGNFLFSIISGFVIQQQWRKWDILMDATRSEINMLRQLFIVAHHFPVGERNKIRFRIYRYLDVYVKSSKKKDWQYRSTKVDEALIRIEDALFDVSKKYPDAGTFAFSYLARAMEYREIKLQNSSHKLPFPIRLFLYFATAAVIIGSFFLPFVNQYFNYYFTLVDASLAFGILLIVDDFDHPLKPGIYYLSADPYNTLRSEVRAKLESYSFNFEKAEKKELHNSNDV